MPNEQQIGLREKGKGIVRKPTLCAVSGEPCESKHHVTHHGPNGQFVYVLSQHDHLWPKYAPVYGFPVPETVDPNARPKDAFVAEELKPLAMPAQEPTVHSGDVIARTSDVQDFSLRATDSALSEGTLMTEAPNTLGKKPKGSQ